MLKEHIEREKYIREHIVEIAEESFPDDIGLKWTIHGFAHNDYITTVEVEPSPQVVGYPRLRFVMTFEETQRPEVAACYCLDEGSWHLLFTNPDCDADIPL